MSMKERLLSLVAVVARRAAWAPIAVFVFHVILESVFDVYNRWPRADIPMHFLGGVVITYFFLHVFEAAAELDLLGRPNRTALVVLAFLAGCTTTILWEGYEWGLDFFFQAGAQEGLNDTMKDMAIGSLGAACYLACASLRLPRAAQAPAPALES
jgi:hypothetical protein